MPLAAVSLLLAISCLSVVSGKSPASLPATSVAPQDSAEPFWMARLRLWRTAVERHEMGQVDDSVVGINAWSPWDLKAVFADAVALRNLLTKAYRASSRTLTYSGRTLRIAEVERLLDVGSDEAARGDLNRLLQRGAMLHTDIGMLLQADVISAPLLGIRVLRSRDARAGGYEVTAHWEMARKLLDYVSPAPSESAFVRSWYRATAAFMLANYKFAYAEPHLEAGRWIFPADPALLFDTGCLNESYAAPLVQSIVRADRNRSGLSIARPSAHWRQAEQFFRKALASDSTMIDAHLHLGRVVGLLGRHEEAIAELERAVDGAGVDSLRYYGEMFLGNEEQALGHLEAARAHYEKAAQLYPSAQSPPVALSYLGQLDGDRSAALSAIGQGFEAAAQRRPGGDPWWVYFVAPFGNAEDLLAGCRSALSSRERQ